ERVSKGFGGLLALDDVSLTADAGRITALIGPNGAGKTTLFSVISGFLTPSAGRVLHNGTDITGQQPYLLARRGIARTFQIVQPFAGLTGHENIAIGAHRTRRSRGEALAAAAEVARTLGLADVLDRRAAGLTLALRKRLEVARALATDPQLLLLDEVLAGLNPSEVGAMLPVIRGIVGAGVSILMTEHVMQAVLSLADHGFVFAVGRIVADRGPRALGPHPPPV